MHGSHSAFDIGHCTVIHRDAEKVGRWLTNESREKLIFV